MSAYTMTTDPAAVARAALQAYVDKNRGVIESLVADDYVFTSPNDNRLDRNSYFAICWPNSATTDRIDVLQVFEDGGRAIILYELTAGQKRIRNCEMHTVRDAKLVSTEVFFGWEVPHRVPEGQHKDSHAAASA
jgi:hypothetical protein